MGVNGCHDGLLINKSLSSACIPAAGGLLTGVSLLSCAAHIVVAAQAASFTLHRTCTLAQHMQISQAQAQDTLKSSMFQFNILALAVIT
eukprot:1143632-Pelagomonas_calceolata.AAC.4